MPSVKKALKKSFFDSHHGTDLMNDLAKEYLRQAGVTSVGQISNDVRIKPLREALRPSLKRRGRSALGKGVKRLAKK